MESFRAEQSVIACAKLPSYGVFRIKVDGIQQYFPLSSSIYLFYSNPLTLKKVLILFKTYPNFKNYFKFSKFWLNFSDRSEV